MFDFKFMILINLCHLVINNLYKVILPFVESSRFPQSTNNDDFFAEVSFLFTYRMQQQNIWARVYTEMWKL